MACSLWDLYETGIEQNRGKTDGKSSGPEIDMNHLEESREAEMGEICEKIGFPFKGFQKIKKFGEKLVKGFFKLHGHKSTEPKQFLSEEEAKVSFLKYFNFLENILLNEFSNKKNLYKN